MRSRSAPGIARVALLALGALVLGGCPDNSVAAATGAAPRGAGGVAGDGEARALALFPVAPRAAGTRGTPVEQRLGEAQEAARQRPGKAASWVDVGDAWVLLSRERTDPGFFLHADGAARLALSLSPDNGAARRLHAATLLNEHRFRAAADEAAAALAKDPDDVLAHGLSSDALLELGDVDGARRAATAWLERAPGSLGPHARLLWLSFLTGDVDAAARHADAALADAAVADGATGEARAFVAVDAGMVAFWTGDVVTARKRFEQALGLWPSSPPARVGLARLHLAEGRAADAATLLREAWQRQPLVETGALLVSAQLASGDDAGARRQARETLAFARQTDPRSTAQWLVDRGGDDGTVTAVSIAEAARLIAEELTVRDDLYTHDVAAAVALVRGDLAAARRHSDRALALGTPDPRLRARAGLVRAAQSDDDDDGSALLRQALSAGPAFDPLLAPRARAALQGTP